MSYAPRGTFVIPVIMLAILSVVASGCASSSNLSTIEGSDQFQKQVLESKTPVVVDFYKNGCPTCVVQEGVLDGLAKEYSGKITFVKFKIREAYFVTSNKEIMDRYKLMWVPTTMLFVNGKEKQRWTFNHGADEIRPALDEAIGAPKTGTQPVPRATELKAANAAADSATGCIEGKGCPINRW